MDKVYTAFALDPASIVTLESYLQDYFSRILKKLKQIDFEQNKKQSRKKTPFKSS
jgi:hypothetical protein